MKIFLSQYLISEGFKKGQEHAINLLTDLLIRCNLNLAQYSSLNIKKIGVKVKRITQLQGRNETNIFQLLFEVDTNLKITISSILEYIQEQRDNQLKEIQDQTKEDAPKPKRENYFIHNLIKDIYQNESVNEIEEEREYGNIRKQDDNFDIQRGIEDVKNIKTLSESRSIMKLINRKQPELPKSKEPEELEGIKESDIKLLKAQQKRYFVSQILKIRRPVEEINSKRKLEIKDIDELDEYEEMKKSKKGEIIVKELEEEDEIQEERQKKTEQKQSNTLNPFSIPSKKVKEIKIDDFSI